MKKFISRSMLVVVIVVFVCLISLLWVTWGREMMGRYSFARKICENLMNSESVPYESCYISNEVPDVMESMFPIGTDISFVQSAMQGFELNSKASGISSSCSQWVRLDFTIIHRWAFLVDESYEFIFCDGDLVDRIWHE